MEFYVVKDTTDEKVAGIADFQVYGFIKEYNPNASYALYELYEYKTSFPNFIPNLDGMKLSGGSKLTDFLSNSFQTIIISPQAKMIMEKFNLCPHRFYPMSVYARRKKIDYFWLKLVSDYSDYVDYKKSTFVEYNIGSEKIFNYVSVISKEDLLQKRKIVKDKTGDILQTIWGENIVMNNSFDNDLDFFIISTIDSSTYISNRLKNAVESNGLTGWEFIPANNLVIPQCARICCSCEQEKENLQEIEISIKTEGQYYKQPNYAQQIKEKLVKFGEDTPNFTPEQAADAVRKIGNQAEIDKD